MTTHHSDSADVQDVRTDPSEPSTGRIDPDGGSSDTPLAGAAPATPRTGHVAATFGRFGVATAFVASIVLFSVLRPHVFPTWDNATSILNNAAIGILIAVALTVVLVMGDFDLSVGAMLGLGAALSAVVMANHHQSWVVALLCVLGVGIVVGLVNGVLVARLDINSFIATLATASAITGLEYYVTGQKTIFQGLPEGFLQLATTRWFGLSVFLVIAAGISIVLYVVMHHLEVGRFMYAIGTNRVAAHLTGVRVTGLRIAGFVIAAMVSGVGGFLLVSQAGSYYPNAGPSYLLPAYAAAFLGAAFFRDLLFRVLATLFGVLFLQMLQTGLTQLNLEAWVTNLVQGAVLVFALLLGRSGRARS